MPGIGRPPSQQERSFQSVQIERRPSKVSEQQKVNLAKAEKERLISKLTGFKQNDPLYKDAKDHNKMGKNEFLKLLTVQLQNQDPLNPMEQGKMAAELAQFSQLEQLSNLNTSFDKFGSNKGIEDKFYGASFLGKEVVTSGSSLSFNGKGTSSDILFQLPKPAGKVLIRIFDKKNNMVGEMWKENIGRGNQTVSWDGRRLDGAFEKEGEYRTQVMAWDDTSEALDVKTKSIGQVESVFFEDGESVLLVGGKKVFLRDVDSFHIPGKTKDIQKSLATKAGMLSNSQQQANNLMAQKTRPANVGTSNLPIASSKSSEVQLKKINTQSGLKSYKEQEPTTGITSVYDE